MRRQTFALSRPPGVGRKHPRSSRTPHAIPFRFAPGREHPCLPTRHDEHRTRRCRGARAAAVAVGPRGARRSPAASIAESSAPTSSRCSRCKVVKHRGPSAMPDPSSSGELRLGSFARRMPISVKGLDRSRTRLAGGLSCGGSIWHEIKLSTTATLLRPLDVHPPRVTHQRRTPPPPRTRAGLPLWS